jgi:hypothetical protein
MISFTTYFDIETGEVNSRNSSGDVGKSIRPLCYYCSFIVHQHQPDERRHMLMLSPSSSLPHVCSAFWPESVVHSLGCHSTHHPAIHPVKKEIDVKKVNARPDWLSVS